MDKAVSCSPEMSHRLVRSRWEVFSSELDEARNVIKEGKNAEKHIPASSEEELSDMQSRPVREPQECCPRTELGEGGFPVHGGVPAKRWGCIQGSRHLFSTPTLELTASGRGDKKR